MRVLVTGGAGFIRSNLVYRLVDEGFSVCVVDNLHTGRLDNLRDVLDRVRFERCDAVILDALRFPSPSDGRLFFSCFCGCCRRFMVELGFDPGVLAGWVRRVAEMFCRYPYLELEALRGFHQFIYVRQRAVEAVLERLSEAAGGLGVELWAAVFPPSLAWLVGQNYGVLRRYLAHVQVMLYHSGGGPACLNHELSSLLKLLGESDGSVFAIRCLTGLYVPDEASLELPDFMAGLVVSEAERCRRLLGDSVAPILWGDAFLPRVSEKVEEMFESIAIFKVRA